MSLSRSAGLHFSIVLMHTFTLVDSYCSHGVFTVGNFFIDDLYLLTCFLSACICVEWLRLEM